MIGGGIFRSFAGQVNTIKAAVLASLAASNAASLLGYIRGEAGAVARTVQDAQRERVSLDDFLTPEQRTAVHTNVWDGIDITVFTAAVQAAFDAAKFGTLEIASPAAIKVNRPIVWGHYTAVVGGGVPARELGVVFFPDLSVDWPTLYPNQGVLTSANYLFGISAHPSAVASFWTGVGKQFQVRADVDAANYAAFRSRVPDWGIVLWCPNESVLMEHVQPMNFKRGNWLCGGVSSVPTFLHCNGSNAGAGQDTVFGDAVTRPAAAFAQAVSVYWDVSASTAVMLEAATATDLDGLAVGNSLTINGVAYNVAALPALTAAINDRTVIGGVVTTARFYRRVTLGANLTANGRIYPAGIAFRNHPNLTFAPGVGAADGGRGNSGSARLIGFSGDGNAALIFSNGAQTLEIVGPKSEVNNSLIHLSGSANGGGRGRVQISAYRAEGFGSFDGGLVRITGTARPSVVLGTGQATLYTYVLNDETPSGAAEKLSLASLYGQGGLHYCTDGSEVPSYSGLRTWQLTVGDSINGSPTLSIVDGTDSVNRRMSFRVASATDVYRIGVGSTKADVFTIGSNTGNNAYLWAYNGAATEKLVKLFTSGGVAAVQIGQTAAQRVSFFGAVPVVQQTLPAAAADPANTMVLANALRTALINLGLAV